MSSQVYLLLFLMYQEPSLYLPSGSFSSLTFASPAGHMELVFPVVCSSPASWLVQAMEDLLLQYLGKLLLEVSNLKLFFPSSNNF